MAPVLKALQPLTLLTILLAQILAGYFLGFSNSWSEVFNFNHLLVYTSSILIGAFGFLFDFASTGKSENQPVDSSEKQIAGRIMILSLFLACTGLLTGFLFSFRLGNYLTFTFAIIVLQVLFFKKWPVIGVIISSLLAAAPFLILIPFDINLKINLVLLFAVYSFGIQFLISLINDALNVESDNLRNYRTLSVLAGVRATKTFMIVIIFLYILVFTSGVRLVVDNYFTSPLSYIFLAFNLLCIGLPLFHILAKLQMSNFQTNYQYLQGVGVYVRIMILLSMLLF